MRSLPTLDWWEVFLRLALAAALGAAIRVGSARTTLAPEVRNAWKP